MLKKPYRVIYNQDCSNLFHVVNKANELITPYHVEQMVDEVAEGGADLLLINPNGQIGRVNYPSHVWQPYWEKSDDYKQYKHLADQGCDYLERSLERCRQDGISAGISVRMNDVHNTPWPDDPVHSDFYRQHPEWRIQCPAYSDRGDYGIVYAMDYSRQEVRDYYMLLIRELVIDYHPEVLELDFMRFPLFFMPSEAKQHSGIMTSFVREIRNIDKSIYIMVRVPVTPAAATDFGLNVADWAHEQLVDGVIVAAHFNTAWDMDMPLWRKVVGDNVALYAGADSAAYCPYGLPSPTAHDDRTDCVMALDEHLMFGFTLAHRTAGADGVYFFNFFCAREWKSRDPLFRALGQLREPDALQGRGKKYCITTAGDGNYFNIGESDGSLQVPRALHSRRPQEFHIWIGKEPSGIMVEIEIVVITTEPIEDVSRIHLHVNEFSIGTPEEIRDIAEHVSDSIVQAVIFRLTSDKLRECRNIFVIRNDGKPANIVSLVVNIVP